MSQGREMSRKQLLQFCGSEDSDDEDEAGKLEKISSSQDRGGEPEVEEVVPVEEQSPEPQKEEANENES